MNKYLKESLLWILIILPYVYLAIIWNKLPEQVPTHFNLRGDVDAMSTKISLIFLPGALSLGIYIIMLLIPIVDPRKSGRWVTNILPSVLC